MLRLLSFHKYIFLPIGTNYAGTKGKEERGLNYCPRPLFDARREEGGRRCSGMETLIRRPTSPPLALVLSPSPTPTLWIAGMA